MTHVSCDKELTQGQLTITCATCTLQFHTQCQKITKGKLKIIQEDAGILWFCQACNKTTKNMISKMSQMELRLNNIEIKMEASNKEFEELQNHCKLLQNKNADLENQVTESRETINDLTEQLELQSITTDNLRRDLLKEHEKNISIDQRLDCLEQSSKSKNVRIVGLPEINNVDLTKQVTELLSLPNINEEDIQSTYRLGKERDGKRRDVIVRFVSQEKRDIFYSKRKETPKGNDNKKAFINDDLTPFRSKLFFDVRRLAKSNRIDSAWTQEGNIIIKVNKDAAPVAITTHEELRSKVFGSRIENSDIESELSYSIENLVDHDITSADYN